MITDVLTDYNIPDCSVIDYTDGDKVFGAGHLLLSLMQRTDPYRNRDVAPAPASAVIKAARQWIAGVERCVDALPARQIITALSPFDLLHRMAYGRPASTEFLNRWYIHVFNAKIHGDNHISDVELMSVISDRLSRRDPLYSDRPLLWYSATLDRWMQLCGTAAKFDGIPLDEALSIAASLLDNDLFVYVPDQEAFKRRLATCCVRRLADTVVGCTPHVDDTVVSNSPQLTDRAAADILCFADANAADNLHLADAAVSDPATFRAALNFVRTARHRYMTDALAARLEQHLLRHLSRTSTLDPNDREAYRLDLGYLLAPFLD